MNGCRYSLPDDAHRAMVTLTILELNNLMHQFFAFASDPVSACVVASAAAHGCAIGTPFGMSKLADLCSMSRRKVYDTMDELIGVGLFIKTRIEGISYPVYVRNLKAPQQEKLVPDVYAAITQACQMLCPQGCKP